MKGIEGLFASMIGIDPAELQSMMKGFIDNASFIAENVKTIIDKQDQILAELERFENEQRKN